MAANLEDVQPFPLVPRTDAPWSGVRAIAFDLDCTLVDILPVKRRAAEAAAWAFADAGLDLDPATAAESMLRFAFDVGLDHDDVPERWLEAHGIDAPRVAQAARRAYERAETLAATPYPRVRRTLEALARRGYRLALVTDADRHRAERRLAGAGLRDLFHAVVAREDTPHGKRGTEPYAVAAARLGLPAEGILMVGDNPRLDVASARAAGCRAVLAEYGLVDGFRDPASEALADGRIRWIDELLTVLPHREARAVLSNGSAPLETPKPTREPGRQADRPASAPRKEASP